MNAFIHSFITLRYSLNLLPPPCHPPTFQGIIVLALDLDLEPLMLGVILLLLVLLSLRQGSRVHGLRQGSRVYGSLLMQAPWQAGGSLG